MTALARTPSNPPVNACPENRGFTRPTTSKQAGAQGHRQAQARADRRTTQGHRRADAEVTARRGQRPRLPTRGADVRCPLRAHRTRPCSARGLRTLRGAESRNDERLAAGRALPDCRRRPGSATSSREWKRSSTRRWPTSNRCRCTSSGLSQLSTFRAEHVLRVLDYRSQHSLRNIAPVPHDGSVRPRPRPPSMTATLPARNFDQVSSSARRLSRNVDRE